MEVEALPGAVVPHHANSMSRSRSAVPKPPVPVPEGGACVGSYRVAVSAEAHRNLGRTVRAMLLLRLQVQRDVGFFQSLLSTLRFNRIVAIQREHSRTHMSALGDHLIEEAPNESRVSCCARQLPGCFRSRRRCAASCERSQCGQTSTAKVYRLRETRRRRHKGYLCSRRGPSQP